LSRKETFRMNTRNVLLGVMVLLLFAGLPSIAPAAVLSTAYTGPLFCQYGGNLFTAQLNISPLTGAGYGVVFQGLTALGTLYTTVPVLSDGSGAAVACANWPINCYRFLATGLDLPPVSSTENIVTVYSPYVRGIACGGEVAVGPIPTRATVGFVYEGMLPFYIPPGASGSAAAPYASIVTFMMDIDPYVPSSTPGYRLWSIYPKTVTINVTSGKVASVDVVGKCYFVQGAGQTEYINMQARFNFVTDPQYPLLTLKVWRQTMTTYTVIIDEQNRQIKNGGFFVKTM
jgi:hypothetical protein